MKRVHVAAAVIRNNSGDILIAKRPDSKHQGGLWEFPGGKVEGDETVEEALVRELQEEIGITATSFRPLIRISHDYPDKQILLDVWTVDDFRGEAVGLEQQPVQWVAASMLDQFAFPEANLPIVAAAQLPDRYLITPEPDEVEDIEQWLELRLQAGFRLVQCRAKSLASPDYLELASRLLRRCQAYDAQLLLNGSPDLLMQLPEAAGIHLPVGELSRLSARPVPPEKWIAASVHDLDELQLAERLNVDFVVLSPVAATASHPGRLPLGWDGFAAITSRAKLPVYALGGMTVQDMEQAWHSGAQGIAGIRGL